MGVVSGATLDAGGSVTGVVPEAMIIASPQSGKAISSEGQGEVKGVILNESAHENVRPSPPFSRGRVERCWMCRWNK